MKKTIKVIVLLTILSLPTSYSYATFNMRSAGLTTLGCAIALASGLKLINALDKFLEDDTVAPNDGSSEKKLSHALRYGLAFLATTVGTFAGVYIVANANNERFLFRDTNNNTQNNTNNTIQTN